MAGMPQTSSRLSAQHSSFSSMVLLASWRIRHMLGMLLITGIGLIAAVMLVCAIPLYSEVTVISGLHNVLTATPDSSTITLHVTMAGLSSQALHDAEQRFQSYARTTLTGYTKSSAQFSVQTAQGLPILSPAQKQTSRLMLYGFAINEASQHLQLLQGRLPQGNNNDEIEIALTRQSAQSLNVQVGSTLTAPLKGSDGQYADTKRKEVGGNVTFRVVGIYTASTTTDTFWHGINFDPYQPQTSSEEVTLYSALTENDALLKTIDRLAATAQKQAQQSQPVLFSPPISELYWYYQLNSLQLSTDQLQQLRQRLSTFQRSVANNYGIEQLNPDFPYVKSAVVSGAALRSDTGSGTLERYSNRVDIALIPISILMVLAIGLILFFVAMMAELLVERQTGAIATLRSRGASRRQIFGSFVLQGVLMGIIALLAGPLLALLTIYLLALRLFGPNGQSALQLVLAAPWRLAATMGIYALATVLVGIVAMSLAMHRALLLDILVLRRQSARETTRPLWQRYRLDIVAIVIALAGYGISLYLSRLQDLDALTRSLIVSPLTLIMPFFLALAAVLLLLRLYPWLLRLAARIAAHTRGFAAVLALGQMARAPRHSIRLILLLALTSGFAVFSLIFTASQTHHAQETAAFRVGADISGPITSPQPILSATDLSTNTARLTSIPGVKAASLGYSDSINVVWETPYPLELRAVDSSTFAQSAIWPTYLSKESLPTLMNKLAEQRKSAIEQNVVAAVVDTLTWQRLGLADNPTFAIQAVEATDDIEGVIPCLAIAHVDHIPGVDDSTTELDSNGSVFLPGGILVDYQNYATVFKKQVRQTAPVNYAWLSTVDNPEQLTTIRKTLSSDTGLEMTTINDRRTLAESLRSDPLYLNLFGELALGATTALLLALLGSLLASWLHTRMRQTSFAALRALGGSLQQIAGMLTWEQLIIYIVALVLGLGLGALLSFTTLPALVSNSIPTTGAKSEQLPGADFALQQMLPVQLIIPTTLWCVLAVVIVLCVIVLTLVIRVSTRPSIGQELRLNED